MSEVDNIMKWYNAWEARVINDEPQTREDISMIKWLVNRVLRDKGHPGTPSNYDSLIGKGLEDWQENFQGRKHYK